MLQDCETDLCVLSRPDYATDSNSQDFAIETDQRWATCVTAQTPDDFLILHCETVLNEKARASVRT